MGSATPLSNRTCPVCGGPNGCRPAETGTFEGECWCATMKISPEALGAVPAEIKGKACLCERCATAAREGRRPSSDVGSP